MAKTTVWIMFILPLQGGRWLTLRAHVFYFQAFFRTGQCVNSKQLKYFTIFSRYSEKHFSSCTMYRMKDPDVNAQFVLEIDLIRTTFLSLLMRKCQDDYGVIHDGA